MKDTTGDGLIDSIVDADGNSVNSGAVDNPDLTGGLKDTTGDGITETLQVDTTGDGHMDTVFKDTTGDGKFDTVVKVAKEDKESQNL